jgi:hypothetical protein
MWRLARCGVRPPVGGTVLLVLAAILPMNRAGAAVVFMNLGTAAPPSAVGTFAVTPYDLVPQTAIPNLTNTSVIPGSPVAPDTTASFPVQKRTVGDGWASWSHGYTGPVFYTVPVVPPLMLTIAPAKAFYVYVEPAAGRSFAVSVVTNAGGSSGPVPVDASGGATGFGFYTTAGESITSVTIDVDDPNAQGFAFAELGLGLSAVGTPSPTPTRTPHSGNGGCSVPGSASTSTAGLVLLGAIMLWWVRVSSN